MTDYNTITKKLLNKIDKDLVRGYRDEEGKKVYPEVKDAADWYNVSYSSLRKKVGKLNWQDRRTDYIAKVNRKVQEKKNLNDEEISEAEAEAIVVEDYHFNNAANKLRRAIVTEIEKIVDGKIYLYSTKDGSPVYGTPRNAGYLLMNLGKALESAQKVSKLAAGEPNNIDETRGTVKHEMSDFSNDERERIKELARGLTKPDNPKQQNSDS